jgi:hypothetical protein
VFNICSMVTSTFLHANVSVRLTTPVLHGVAEAAYLM